MTDELRADEIAWSQLSLPVPAAVRALRDPEHTPPTTDDLCRRAGLYELRAGSPADDVADRLRRLAAGLNGTDAIGRAAIRARAIEVLTAHGVRGPARLVDAALGTTDAAAAETRAIVRDDDPWPEPVDGAALLETVTDLLAHHVVLPAHADTAVALWLAHTYLMDVWSISPLLIVTSPAPRCGKTTLLLLAARLAHRALAASSISAAAIYRIIESHTPALLLDEAETYLRRAGHDDDGMRGIIDGGHTRDTARVIRCVGDDHVPTVCSTWCAKLLALIGAPPATIVDRAVTITLRRRLPSESVARLRTDRLEAACAPLRRQFRRWADDHAEVLHDADPDVPDTLHDRAADNWRSLLAIADVVGGVWPARARRAAVALSSGAIEEPAAVQLLADLRGIWAEAGDPELLASTYLVERLTGLEDRPWPEWRDGRPLTTRGLARLLSAYGVAPDQHRIAGGRPTRSYRRASLAEAWERYTVSTVSTSEVPPAQVLQRDNVNDDGPASRLEKRDSDGDRHTYASVTEADSTGASHAVTHVRRGIGQVDTGDDDAGLF